MPEAPFVPVVPAGGSGTRLWPLSRRSRPKFLLDLTGSGRSLLQQTLDRLLPLADAPPVVVTGQAHAPAVAEQLGETARILAEPSPRNSMPAIALAAAVIEREHPRAIIGSFAADHLITDTDAFTAGVTAARAAAAEGYLVTLGIEPTHPATGFGYIECSEHPDPRLHRSGAHPVARFVEKPDRERAEQFLATGRFFWNAGMFVVGARVLLDALAEQIPALAAGARRIAAALDGPEGDDVMAEVWPTLTAIAIDHALAEPLAARGQVAVVPAGFDWDDVGDFASLARQLGTARGTESGSEVSRGGAEGGSARGSEAGDVDGVDGAPTGVRHLRVHGSEVSVLGGARVHPRGARATVYGSPHRAIALIGVEGISVVDTEDALLVVADEHAQSLADLVADLDAAGESDLR